MLTQKGRCEGDPYIPAVSRRSFLRLAPFWFQPGVNTTPAAILHNGAWGSPQHSPSPDRPPANHLDCDLPSSSGPTFVSCKGRSLFLPAALRVLVSLGGGPSALDFPGLTQSHPCSPLRPRVPPACRCWILSLWTVFRRKIVIYYNWLWSLPLPAGRFWTRWASISSLEKWRQQMPNSQGPS